MNGKPRLATVPIDDEDGLKSALRYIYTLLGLRPHQFPDALDKAFLHDYLLRHYGGHTAAELKLAFDLAVRQELDLPARDVECYGNFSVAYVSRILGAYRDWAAARIPRPAPPAAPLPDPTERVWVELTYAHHRLTLINKLPCRVITA